MSLPRSALRGREQTRELTLTALFLAEFDNRYGRTLSFQEPALAISPDEFDAISDYLIPKPVLCNRLAVLRCSPNWTSSGRRALVLGWPVCMEDEKYSRNALIFTLGFVFYNVAEGANGDVIAASAPSLEAASRLSWDLEACARYGPVLAKASDHLSTLERESGMLSDTTRKGELARLLPQVLHGLQQHSCCAVAVDGANTLQLQLTPRWPAPTPHCISAVRDHMVPVLVAPAEPSAGCCWDLTAQKLLRWIDGTRHVVAIAAAARADLSRVRRTLGALAHSGWVRPAVHRQLFTWAILNCTTAYTLSCQVRLVDAFAVDNAYAATPRLNAIANEVCRLPAALPILYRDAATQSGRPHSTLLGVPQMRFWLGGEKHFRLTK
jgi:hypothetical protein